MKKRTFIIGFICSLICLFLSIVSVTTLATRSSIDGTYSRTKKVYYEGTKSLINQTEIWEVQGNKATFTYKCKELSITNIEEFDIELTDDGYLLVPVDKSKHYRYGAERNTITFCKFLGSYDYGILSAFIVGIVVLAASAAVLGIFTFKYLKCNSEEREQRKQLKTAKRKAKLLAELDEINRKDKANGDKTDD